MATAAESSLSRAERRTLDRLTAALESALGEDLLALWLFGSKARGEPAGPETDIDLVLVTRRGSREDGELVRRLLERAAGAEGTFPLAFQTILHTPEEVAERRAKDTFFMREVDRGKIVLAGSEGDEFGERIAFTRRGPGERGGVRARSKDYLTDARECLAAAKVTLDRELPSRTISEAYYSMFFAARTALSEEDVFARTHAGVWHRFYEVFIASGRFPAELHARAGQGAEERMNADYESARYSYEDGLDAVRAAERFLAATLEMLEQ